MSDVTRILGQMESGDQKAAEEMLPLVYEDRYTVFGRQGAPENTASGVTTGPRDLHSSHGIPQGGHFAPSTSSSELSVPVPVSGFEPQWSY